MNILQQLTASPSSQSRQSLQNMQSMQNSRARSGLQMSIGRRVTALSRWIARLAPASPIQVNAAQVFHLAALLAKRDSARDSLALAVAEQRIEQYLAHLETDYRVVIPIAALSAASVALHSTELAHQAG